MEFQGTIATEFLNQVPDLDAILVPISGGGMTSGIAVATKGIRPECKSKYFIILQLRTFVVSCIDIKIY